MVPEMRFRISLTALSRTLEIGDLLLRLAVHAARTLRDVLLRACCLFHASYEWFSQWYQWFS